MSEQPVDNRRKPGCPRKYSVGDKCNKCDRPVHANLLCVNHYQQANRAKRREAPCTAGKRHTWDETDHCERCGVMRKNPPDLLLRAKRKVQALQRQVTAMQTELAVLHAIVYGD